jgi:uncharacterized membrane protein (DUF4010 family)
MLIDALQPFVISLLVGLGVGIERERHQVGEEKSLGVRSFALVALGGTVVGRAQEPALTLALGLAVAALLAISYRRSADAGLTTELAAGVVFGLGYLATTEPTLVAVTGVIVATLLFSRQRLHLFSQHLSMDELRAALLLAAVAIVILPFLPDQAVDPWGLVNPRRFAQIVMLIMAIEFGGYVVERVAGARIGALATGFFGGLASSTAVFANLPRVVKAHPESLGAALGAGLMATSATVCLFVAVAAGTAPDLSTGVAVPAGVMALVAAVLGIAVARKAPASPPGERATRRNPLDLRGVLKLSALVTLLFALTLAVKRLVGPDAVVLLGFVGGLFELQSVTFATANLHAAGSLEALQATQALLAALLASFVSKVALSWVLGAGRFAFAMTGLLGCVIAAGAAVAWVAMRGWPV